MASTSKLLPWRAHWGETVSKDPASRVTYEPSPAGPSTTKLRIVHDDFESEIATYRESVAGWPVILWSLKTLLETGQPLQLKTGA